MGKYTGFNVFLRHALKYGFSLYGLPKTGQTTVYQAGDDGTYQKGYPRVGVRFVDNGDGTITDNATGLMWQKASSGSEKTWLQAISYCETLTVGGYTDWRLPNLLELISLFNFSKTGTRWNTDFFSGLADIFWSSTTDAANTLKAWAVSFSSSYASQATKTDAAWYTRAVRGGF